MAMTFDGQRSSCRSDVEKTGQCAKEEVSSSLLGKLAPPFLCYKHIPSYVTIQGYRVAQCNLHRTGLASGSVPHAEAFYLATGL